MSKACANITPWLCTTGVRRLEDHAEQARQITEETTYRIWRLYMAASAHRFRSARLNLYHTLLAKPLNGWGIGCDGAELIEGAHHTLHTRLRPLVARDSLYLVRSNQTNDLFAPDDDVTAKAAV